MRPLQGKKILIGVTGSIAAFKIPELIRLLKDQQADVKVVMTNDAKQFITELTLQAISGTPVHSELLDPATEASMSHITLAKWADVLMIVPATANIIAKLSNGIADDLLSTLYLATEAPLVIVPAMNQAMWRHPATQANIDVLQQRGVTLFGPSYGSQACGDLGPGRMIEPVTIIETLDAFFTPKLLQDVNVVITAGPTRERLDPIRYLSNFSSGKMGYALARAAQVLGAKVTLISGPTALSTPSGVSTIFVESAEEMYRAVVATLATCQILVGCAAVADFKIKDIAPHKIKKSEMLELRLEKNIDILKEVGNLDSKPFLVGFAAETQAVIASAKQKLQQKNLNMIVANKIGEQDSGFDSDFNQVTVIMPEREIRFDRMSKQDLASELWHLIHQQYLEVLTTKILK